MQTWRALCYDRDLRRLVPRHLPAAKADLQAGFLAGTGVQQVIVSRDEADGAATTWPEAFGQQRRKKDERKPLSAYLPAHERKARVIAPYRDPGQAERGVRALADSSRGRTWTGTLVIEVEPKLFDLLWDRAGLAVLDSPAHRLYVEGGDAGQLQKVLEAEFDDTPIPEALASAFVGQSPAAAWVRRLVVLAARTDHPVLVIGESGTGKEVVARQIHELSSRRTRSLITVNCAAIAHDLLESEVFGHARGAFTGADRDKQGLYEMAGGGTFFLDEVGELAPAHQAKVLRLVGDGLFRRVGETTERRGDARIVAATNRDLAAMVRAGRFREDLYYRLLSFTIRTPAVREHPDDIPVLAAHFWKRIAPPASGELPRSVLALLSSYPWYGNARELIAFLAGVSTYAGNRTPTPALVRAVFQGWTGNRLPLSNP